MSSPSKAIRVLLLTALAIFAAQVVRAQDVPPRAVLDKYCVTCHNTRAKTAGLMLDTLDLSTLSAHTDIGEAIVRKMRAGMMPPPGSPRPDHDAYATTRGWFEKELDRI